MIDIDNLSPERRDYLQVFGNIWKPSKVAPGTCELCVFGRGEHSPSCLQSQINRARSMAADAREAVLDMAYDLNRRGIL